MTTDPRSGFLRIVTPALALVLALTVAACGDDGDTTTASDDGTTVPAGDDSTGGGDGADGGDDSSEPTTGTGSATLTIAGREQFNFEEELVCIALGGAVSGTFRNDEGVEVSIDVPPEDWETSTTGDWEAPSLTLRDERDEMNWRIFEAGPEIATTYPGAEGAVITNFSVDGSHATGNGMAIDTFAFSRATADGGEAPQPVPVTFGFECS
ncbi:MAG: hypothetical protein RIB98_05410 [Acidimicrobiales bacterium]